jgi:hypothetical protein
MLVVNHSRGMMKKKNTQFPGEEKLFDRRAAPSLESGPVFAFPIIVVRVSVGPP